MKNSKRVIKKERRERIFNVMQYLAHPETGETLINAEAVKRGVQNRGIAEYAYILHDKDIYTLEDEEKNSAHKAGLKKPSHYHICIKMRNPATVGTVAKYFGIPENFVNIARGNNGPGKWLDIVEYLTHENEKQQEAGKYRYPDDAVVANFDWRGALDKRAACREKYGRDLSPAQQMRADVLQEGKTLAQCEEEDIALFTADFPRLRQLRTMYLASLPSPAMRINYYVCGEGGQGKDLLSRALARQFFPGLPDKEIFFEVGAGNALFERYDGQPVIIWSDKRAVELLMLLGGRGNLLKVFDVFPGACAGVQNIKYGSVSLCNVINIVNSPEYYIDFLDAIAGEYTDSSGTEHYAEDKKQSYRRFPTIIPVHEHDFEILMNKGYLENSPEYEQFALYGRVRGNFREIRTVCSNDAMAREYEAKMLAPVVAGHHDLAEKMQGALLPENEIRKKLAEFGTFIAGDDNTIEEIPPAPGLETAPEDSDIPWETDYDAKAEKAEQLSFAFGGWEKYNE